MLSGPIMLVLTASRQQYLCVFRRCSARLSLHSRHPRQLVSAFVDVIVLSESMLICWFRARSASTSCEVLFMIICHSYFAILCDSGSLYFSMPNIGSIFLGFPGITCPLCSGAVVFAGCFSIIDSFVVCCGRAIGGVCLSVGLSAVLSLACF